MRFVPFDDANLQAEELAKLLVSADEILYRIQFGSVDNAIKQLTILLEKETNVDHMFKAPHLECVFDDTRFIGVMVTYEGSIMNAVEKNTWWLLIKQMGVLTIFKRVLASRKVRQVTKINMEPEALYVYTIVINEKKRFNGYGEQILSHLHETYDTLYLHVNYKNSDAIAFYEKVGFKKHDEFYDCYKNEPVGALVMRRHRDQKRG